MNSIETPSFYEIALLGPDCANRETEFLREFESRVLDAGLDPAKHTSLVINPGVDYQPTGIPVFVWCGSEGVVSNANHEALVRNAIQKGDPVYPVVDNLINYTGKVPPMLTPFNGLTWERLNELVGFVLHSMGILRREREIFISYRRAESESIAKQLFSLLNGLGYGVFLDTAEVQPGREVQSDLKARLANVDLVVLLHTQKAFTSAWVYEEIIDAQLRGTEVLDVRWWDLNPSDEPRELELTEPFPLDSVDVEEQDVYANGQKVRSSWNLSEDCLARLMPFIEQCRVRSVRTRRDRILKQLCEDAHELGLTATYFPAGTNGLRLVPHVAVERPVGGAASGVVGQIFVSDGTPNAKELHHKSSVLNALPHNVPSCLAYDEFGVLVEDLQHLDWLNQILLDGSSKTLASSRKFAKSLRVGEGYSWIKTL